MNANVKVDVGDNITGLIEKLAHQLGVAADKVFPWYVKQQVIEGCTTLALMAFFLIAGLLLFAFCCREADFNKGNKQAVGTVIGAVLIGLVMLSAVVAGSETVAQIINPQYAATHRILSDVSRLR